MKIPIVLIKIKLLIICLLIGWGHHLHAQQNKLEKIVITGDTYTYNNDDSITLEVHGKFVTSADYDVDSVIKIPNTFNKFKFTVFPDDSSNFFTLSTSEYKTKINNFLFDEKVFAEYPFLPGDSVYVRWFNHELVFYGKPAKRLTLWRDINRYQLKVGESMPSKGMLDDVPSYTQWLNKNETIVQKSIKMLNEHKDGLSEYEYRMLRTEIISRMLKGILRTYSLQNFYSHKMFDGGIRELMRDYYGERLFNAYDLTPTASNLQSPAYLFCQYFKTCILDPNYQALKKGEKMPNDNASDPHRNAAVRKWRTDIIVKSFDGLIRDKLLTLQALLQLKRAAVDDVFFKHILTNLTIPYYKNLVLQYYNTLKKGTAMGDFEFYNVEGKKVKLSDFRGKVILVDVWFPGCSGCVDVARALPEVEEYFRNKAVAFVSICSDRYQKSWLDAIGVNKYDSASSPFFYNKHFSTKNAEYLYTGSIAFKHPFIQKYVPGNSYPALMLIDKHGKLFSYDTPRPDARDGQQKLIAAITSALKQ